jgi:predicted HicB family RNase H-like nuclease
MISIRYRNLRYRGYEGKVWLNTVIGFWGEVVIPNPYCLIDFYVEDFGNVFDEFKDTVDEYLLDRAELNGVEPSPPADEHLPDRSDLVPLYPVFDTDYLVWAVVPPKVGKLTMEHRGYTAIVEWDEESRSYCGSAMDTKGGGVIFWDHTWKKAYQGFKDALDWHLEDCEEDD